MAKLNAKQERFAVALMTTSTITEAFNIANITNATAYKYLKDPDFSAYYMQLRREAMQQATNKLQQSAVLAVRTLENVMKDVENSTSSARVQAARTVLENAYRGLEIDDMQQRIEQLEQKLLNET